MKLNNWFLQDTSGDGDGSAVVDDKGATDNTSGDVGKAVHAADTTDKVETPDTKGFWPEDWRKHVAGEDAKELKRLERFASPADVYKMARQLETKMSSGELKTALPKDPTPEELVQWRKDNGIPESFDKYDTKIDNIVIGEDDKPMVEEFLKAAHAQNMTNEQAKSAIKTYFDIQEKQAQVRAEKDETERIAALDNLNSEWGSSYRTNINMINGVLERFPQEAREAIKNARLADGTAIFNNPDILKGFVAMALEINPGATLVPSGVGDPIKNLDDKIAEIEKTMRDNRTAYNKNEKMQAEYRDLITAREKLKERKAA